MELSINVQSENPLNLTNDDNCRAIISSTHHIRNFVMLLARLYNTHNVIGDGVKTITY